MTKSKSVFNYLLIAIVLGTAYGLSEFLSSNFGSHAKHSVRTSSALYQPLTDFWDRRANTNQFHAMAALITSELGIGSDRGTVKAYIADNFRSPDLTVHEAEQGASLNYYIVAASSKDPRPYRRTVHVWYAMDKDVLTNVSLSFDGAVPDSSPQEKDDA